MWEQLTDLVFLTHVASYALPLVIAAALYLFAAGLIGQLKAPAAARQAEGISASLHRLLLAVRLAARRG